MEYTCFSSSLWLQRRLIFFLFHSCIKGDLGDGFSGDLAHVSVFLKDI